jgi:K(+)-stimulated pyrophosphate-energized sodium pump
VKSMLQGFVLVVVVLAAFAGTPVLAEEMVQATEGAAPDAATSASILAWALWALAPIGAIIGLIFAMYFYKGVMKHSEGDDLMAKIAHNVRQGAMAYLRQQFKVVGIVVILLFGVFSLMTYWLEIPGMTPLGPFAFLTGAFFSALTGYLGMKTATNAGARTANAARDSLNSGLQVAFRSGAVMGLIVVGFALLNISIWFIALYLTGYKDNLSVLVTTLLLSGIGASTQALFARVGGGIFTKAADVGADLVGKVEAGIPEDDPRNPATIADNVGDNVGDVAGMGADLFESYSNSILAAMLLGLAAVAALLKTNATQLDQLRFVFLPMVVAGAGIILSVIGVFAVKTKDGASQKDLLKSLGKGVSLSSVLIVVVSLAVCYLLFGNVAGYGFWGIWLAILTGLIAGLVIGKSTEYYTSADFKPTRGVAENANTGPATVIIEGLAVGMISTWIPVMTVVVGIMLSYAFAGGFSNIAAGLYGIAVAAVGMLSTLGIVLSTDAYGPIADNAGGNAEMSGLGPEVRERTDALDSLGNTTAATGKGFAIGSAALTALALIASFITQVRVTMEQMPEGRNVIKVGDKIVAAADATYMQIAQHFDITLLNPKVIAGMLIGSMLAFVFCALTMRAVGRTAAMMVEEVRRQFREIAGILEGKADPDYAACVDISTKGAQAEMIVPSMLALIVPVATGLLLGVPGVAGLLAAGLATGFSLAVMMANAGGSWDNAKKYIEAGAHGGKGSPAHKAGVVGDTVGDPFKDTSGPSLNILIKLMSMVSVVFAGLIVKYGDLIARLVDQAK